MTTAMAVDRCAGTPTHRAAKKRLFLATLLFAGLAACGGGDDSEPVSIEFATVDRGSFSQLTVSDQFMSRIVRTDSEWQAIWVSNYPSTRPPPAPVVDFGRLMVVGVFLGGRPNGCYDIAVREVREVRLASQEVEVVYTEIAPIGQGCLPVVVTPYQFISIPTTSLPVRFRKI